MKLRRLRCARIKIAVIHFFQSRLTAIGLIFLAGLLIFGLTKTGVFLKKLNIVPQHLISLFQNPKDHLNNSNGQTNLLLLGIKGDNLADVSDLADTIMIISYRYSTKQITTISVPRDLWVDSLKTKINAVYHYGQQRNPPAGIQLIQSALLETLGLQIHYTAVIDFTGFVKAIDLLGGIEINVEKSFADSKFPIPGKENDYPIETRYETVSFNSGPQLMDGPTALKFIRSRQAEGEEGSDFSRGKRQQLLLKSLRQKLLSAKTLLNKSIRSKLLNLVQENLITSLKPDDYPFLINIFISSKNQPFQSISLLSESKNGQIAILENPPRYLYQNQWVLIAKDGNWPALKQYIQNQLK